MLGAAKAQMMCQQQQQQQQSSAGRLKPLLQAKMPVMFSAVHIYHNKSDHTYKIVHIITDLPFE